MISKWKFLAGTAALIVCANALGGSSDDREIPPQATTVAPAPPIMDGCDLLDAMPNCKEEMAKLAAWYVAHPRPPDAPAARARDRGVEAILSAVKTAVQDEENERKAAEASAGVKRQELRRELDRTQHDLERSIAEAKAGAIRDQMDVDRARYGVRVEERHLQAVMGGR